MTSAPYYAVFAAAPGTGLTRARSEIYLHDPVVVPVRVPELQQPWIRRTSSAPPVLYQLGLPLERRPSPDMLEMARVRSPMFGVAAPGAPTPTPFLQPIAPPPPPARRVPTPRQLSEGLSIYNAYPKKLAIGPYSTS